MPLGDLALVEIKSIWPVEGSDPVAPGVCLLGESGFTGLQDFSRIKAALDAAIGDDNWRVHDLRRTARSMMSRLGVASDHAEAALNHISHRSALQRTYDTHDFRPEAVAALQIWQAHVARLLDPGPGAEVVPIRRNRS
jgi:integrase